MPLGAFEREVLRLLAANRNPDSYVAGATVRQVKAEGRTQKAELLHSAFFPLPFRCAPLNRERRFIPLRLAAFLKGALTLRLNEI